MTQIELRTVILEASVNISWLMGVSAMMCLKNKGVHRTLLVYSILMLILLILQYFVYKH